MSGVFPSRSGFGGSKDIGKLDAAPPADGDLKLSDVEGRVDNTKKYR